MASALRVLVKTAVLLCIINSSRRATHAFIPQLIPSTVGRRSNPTRGPIIPIKSIFGVKSTVLLHESNKALPRTRHDDKYVINTQVITPVVASVIFFLSSISGAWAVDNLNPSIFNGAYSDPLHPLCERVIEVSEDGKSFVFRGTAVGGPGDRSKRGCTPAEIEEFGLFTGEFSGAIEGDEILASDGIRKGVWESAWSASDKSMDSVETDGIRWNNGNKWTKLTKEEDGKLEKLAQKVQEKPEDIGAPKAEEIVEEKMDNAKVEEKVEQKVEDNAAPKVEDNTAPKVEETIASKVEDNAASKVEYNVAPKVEEKVEKAEAPKVEAEANTLQEMLQELKEEAGAPKKSFFYFLKKDEPEEEVTEPSKSVTVETNEKMDNVEMIDSSQGSTTEATVETNEKMDEISSKKFEELLPPAPKVEQKAETVVKRNPLESIYADDLF